MIRSQQFSAVGGDEGLAGAGLVLGANDGGPLGATGAGLVLRADNGRLLPLDPARWYGPPTPGEQRLLAGLVQPVLDVGCGPGRIVEALACRGVIALGVDPAPQAAELVRRRGCAVLQRSVFDRLPGEGRWGSVLLLDGNLGIGGEPARLLRRCAALLCSAGSVVAEVEPPGSGWGTWRARLEHGGSFGSWFAWSLVSADSIGAIAAAAGLELRSVECSGEDRWFAELQPSQRRARAGD